MLMKIWILLAFGTIASVSAKDSFSVDDIKVQCDCDKSKWEIEKISLEEVKILRDEIADGALGETRTLTS